MALNVEKREAGYKAYWVTWGVLLALTALMLVTETASLARTVLVGVLLVAMMVKASLIGAEFMHLRSERPLLVLIVAGTVLFLAAFLFILISFDATRISKMVTS